MVNIEIVQATEHTDVQLEGINALLAQLSSSGVVLDEQGWRELVSSEASKVYLLYADGRLAGMLTLCTYLCPTGKKCWIEDVVVDQNFRGMGLGRQLIEHAIAEAGKLGKCSLMLTSRPSRVAANKLYQSAGFEQRETNVYRIKLK